jgi:hypothetical protein
VPQYTWADNDHYWIVSTTVATRDDPQSCPKCGTPGTRQIDLPNLDKTSAGSWNQQSYNPGLGCWTKSTKHAEQIAKQRGLEPIGNEPVDNLHKNFEKQREETRAERWRNADRELVYG